MQSETQHATNALFQRHHAPIAEGITYVDEGSGEPILFLHGALSNSNTWRKVIPILCQHYRCLAIDLPLGGHTIPLSEQTDLSVSGIVDIIFNFLDFLKLSNVVLISNDTGNAYAQVFCAQYPDRVNTLILSNGEGLDIFPPAKFAYLRHAVRVPGFTFSMSKVFSIKRFLKSDLILGLLTLQATNQDLHTLYIKSFVENKNVRKNFSAVARTWSKDVTLSAAEKLKHYHKPVLILWGNEDKALFPMTLAIRLYHLFPKAELATIDGARTYVQEDSPQLMAHHIKTFIEKQVNDENI
ncbi:alpha/beta fold hydrolase [Pseudochryseolinea flava]|uniref:Alpha/beta hydrolase n=1 Tax=Pseudochryseolinea flava TaxID=2059302 RepID=A0A364XZB0_9BACT|nr:alpha/beta hydrolase [Pseudochryseolinea flava]RAV99635.1 alpha/beta hydrolase [Pseudochryseolinea flava]